MYIAIKTFTGNCSKEAKSAKYKQYYKKDSQFLFLAKIDQYHKLFILYAWVVYY
ncbi:hypothetical protein GCM10022259_21150 [Aquimarina mytili]